MRRLPAIALAIATVLVCAWTGYILATFGRIEQPPASTTSRSAVAISTPLSATPSVTPSVSLSASASTTRSPTPTARPAPRQTIAFLGDEDTAGTGSSTPAKRFTTLLAQSLGLVEQNFGVAGTGYAKTTTDEDGTDDYLTRVAAVIAARPDIVVVSGGRNDVTDFPPTFVTRATETFAALRRGLPNATIIGVGPMWIGDEPPAELADIEATVKTAVEAVNGQFLAVPDPLRDEPTLISDDLSINDAGHAAVAAALAPRLKVLLPKN